MKRCGECNVDRIGRQHKTTAKCNIELKTMPEVQLPMGQMCQAKG
jgi:hypothetical protein